MAVIEYRIHPSVGIARMGSSANTFFAGAEEVKDAFTPVLRQIPKSTGFAAGAKFRDGAGELAKQAARFRVFKYEYDAPLGKRATHPTKVTECTAALFDLEWEVEVANIKGRDGTTILKNLPPVQKLSTKVATDLTDPKPLLASSPPNLPLGSVVLESDVPVARDKGTLLVIGSSGEQRPLTGGTPSGLRYHRWEDDAGDGRIRCWVTEKAGGTRTEALAAWVVINLPDYGVDVRKPVSLYDLALNHGMAKSNSTITPKKDFYLSPPNFSKNIRPTIDSYRALPWVHELLKTMYAGGTHAKVPTAKKHESDIVTRLRPPHSDGYVPENFHTSSNTTPPNTASGLQSMPRDATYGDNYAFPNTLYKWMLAWQAAKGSGGLDPGPAAPWTKRSDLDLPEILDVAHMRSISGGSLYPGIEVGRNAADWNFWKADYGAKEGHVDIRFTGTPGDLTNDLACPWQADFYACDGDWWPASRPNVTKRGPKTGTYVPTGSHVAADFKSWEEDDSGVVEITDATALTTKWSKLGFVRRMGSATFPEWIEDDRKLR